MARESRYDILFEPIKIGPVTARNRFYQVPHCNGMGRVHPTSIAVGRGVKAEGGWAVICTEECEIHPTTETNHVEARLWDDRDIPALARSVDMIHEHGSLAGIELCHNSMAVSNLYSREAPMAPSVMPVQGTNPITARAMSLSDIRDFRRWHRNAALRAKEAGFDIVYCYAGHDLELPMHFISRRHNHRIDEYGGSLENRVRLFREMIEETKEAVGDRCAVAVRFAVDELLGPDGITSEGEGREVVEMLAELPDLWDVNVADWANDSVTARFGPEAGQEEQIKFVKSVTSKPVVGVGRFTSPDEMVRQIREGILDMIGAARPSIADPWLPRKIEEGRPEDIRECIGCNICVSGDFTFTPMRCTQNPTMAEEWRKGWHPEKIEPAVTPEETVLIVGAGPAGLEAARACAQRGYKVVLSEARAELGGRVTQESTLPGLSTYARVRDYRERFLLVDPKVEIYRESALTAENILEFGFAHVAIATGSEWRRDGVGRAHLSPLSSLDQAAILTPDDILAGKRPSGKVVLYDDDHYIMGGVLAELMASEGCEVVFVTPETKVSAWTVNTMEQHRIQARLIELGVEIKTDRVLEAYDGGVAKLSCAYTGRPDEAAGETLVLVTSRIPKDDLYQSLAADPAKLEAAGVKTLKAIGDAYGPGTVAAAVYSGHRYARELEAPDIGDAVPFKRELPELAPL